MNYKQPVPQGMLHSARGMYADGMGTRNRSMEQFNTRSGNPNMPMFNTARNAMDAYSRQRAPAPSGGYLGRPPVGGGYLSKPPTGGTPFGSASWTGGPPMAQTMKAPPTSFHRPAPGQVATMPAFAPQARIGSGGERFVPYFGRNLPIRERG
jgi:hypothetical protein